MYALLIVDNGVGLLSSGFYFDAALSWGVLVEVSMLDDDNEDVMMAMALVANFGIFWY